VDQQGARGAVNPANLGAGTSGSRSVTRMARHRITTASLLNDIERQRAEEAASRWNEVSREFMQDDDPREESGADSGETADSARRAG